MGSSQPQGQQRKDDPDLLRDVQLPRHVRLYPGRPFPLRLWTHHRSRPRHWWWCLPRRPHLRGLRPPPRYLASVTSRRSFATSPSTSSRRWPPPPPPLPSRSPTSCPMVRSSLSATSVSAAPSPCSVPLSWAWKSSAFRKAASTPS